MIDFIGGHIIIRIFIYLSSVWHILWNSGSQNESLELGFVALVLPVVSRSTHS